MKHIVITMAREYASGGSEIARMVADELGIPLYNKELISDVASGACTIIGVILLLLSLWIQFGGGPSGDATPRPPRLK